MPEHSRVLPIHVPTVGFKGAHDTDASSFRQAADNLDGGYELGGGNLKAAVARLLRGAADALDASGQPDPDWSFYEYQRRRMANGRD